MNICKYYDICDKKARDDICLESLYCRRRFEYNLEKQKKIEEQDKRNNQESWVIRMQDYNGDVGRR